MDFPKVSVLIGTHHWEDKVWGQTRVTHQSEFYSRHELRTKAGGFCSFHYHSERANRFIVLSGIVRVVWVFGWKPCYKDLAADNVLDVPSLVPHQFQVIQGGEVVEEYFSDRKGTVKNQDITRLSTGGFQKDLQYLKENVGILLPDGTYWDSTKGMEIV